MSSRPYYTQYSLLKENNEILLAQAGEHISEINAIANRVIAAYIEGCRARNILPAKYLVKIESDIEHVSGKLIDTINRLDQQMEIALYNYRKTVGVLLEVTEPELSRKNTEGYYIPTKLSQPDSQYHDILLTTYATSATVEEANAAMKAYEELIPKFFPTSKFAITYKAHLQCLSKKTS